MAERSPKASRRKTQVQASEPIDPVEERVVRMRHGYRAPDDMPLGTKDGGRADVAEQLRQMELEALRKSGRLEALRAQAEAEDEAESAKQKIVEGLKARKSDRDRSD